MYEMNDLKEMKQYQIAQMICRTLNDAGFKAVIAGGAVRDLALGLEPKDFDVASNATPSDVKKLFRAIPVGESFGVCIVMVDGHQFEIAAFRTDGEYLDGRRPSSVEFSSMEEDAKRRDLTINGMFFDPLTEKVIDFVGGMDDIRAGRIRFIGNAQSRIDEDRLRMLRAVRFALKLGFKFDEKDFEVVKANVHRIHDISDERIREELVKMLRVGKPRQMMEMLRDTGLLREILPEVQKMIGCGQNPKWHSEGATVRKITYVD
jgi:poly(A) polymerase